MLTFSPYIKARALPFGLWFLEFGVRAWRINDGDYIEEHTAIFSRRIARNFESALQRHDRFVDFYGKSEEDEHLGV